jgi:putative transposase
MSRPLRIEYENAWYHVMNRGANGQLIYQHDAHRELFLTLLEEIQVRYGVELHAYCLMGNHYHLLVRTPRANLGRAMRHLDGVYTQHYNKSMSRDGVLFRGRYKACLIDADSYLIEVSRYIHLNPVRAKLISRPEQYLWSSYRAYIGLGIPKICIYLEITLSYFKSISNYRKFMESAISTPDDELIKSIRESSMLGSELFIEYVTENYIKDQHKIPEIPCHKEFQKLPTIHEIQSTISQYYNIPIEKLKRCHRRTQHNRISPRALAMFLCVNLSGKKVNEIAEYFNVKTASTISHASNTVKKIIQSDLQLKIDYSAICDLLIS